MEILIMQMQLLTDTRPVNIQDSSPDYTLTITKAPLQKSLSDTDPTLRVTTIALLYFCIGKLKQHSYCHLKQTIVYGKRYVSLSSV